MRINKAALFPNNLGLLRNKRGLLAALEVIAL